MSFNIETKCVQSGYTPKNGEPRVVPIVQSTTYKYESSEQMGRLFDLQESGYFYTRLQNPTNDCVAAKIADLEGGVGAMLTSSGQAASFFSVTTSFKPRTPYFESDSASCSAYSSRLHLRAALPSLWVIT